MVGAGIVGSSIAYHLARRGAEVTVFEKRRPAAGATWDSFAWINAFDKHPRAYFELNRLGMAGYQDLEEDLGELRIEWGGCVQWFADAAGGDWLRDQVRQHRSWGYDTRLISPDELALLEPDIEPGPISAAAYSAEEGNVDPIAATEMLLDAAREAGASVECPVEVIGVECRDGRLEAVTVQIDDRQDRRPADVLVIVAGRETPDVAAMAGVDVPLVYSVGALAHSSPVGRCLSRVVLAPTAHLVQRASGTVVTGVDFGGGPGDASPGDGAGLLAEAAKYLPVLSGVGLDRLAIGQRPMPRDGLPIVGTASAASDVYLAVTHSGVTLAPVLGRMAASEILDGLEFELLEGFRPSRFGES